jgi:hypothetical protein
VRRPLGRAAVALAALGLVAGCGGSKPHSRGRDLRGFDCNARRIEYMVEGGFVAAKAGIRLECDGEGPQLTRWRLESSGERDSKTFTLDAEQFEATWQKIEASGWRFLAETCDSSRADGDPIYTIDVGDSAKSVSLTCQARELPFPYDRLVNELDLRAAGFGDDGGAAR